MHYSASFQLPNFYVAYTVSVRKIKLIQAVTVVFALLLACVAAIAALALFFRARQQWQESFWKRGVCSLFLAAAVCG
jgi:NO-binding membrane sensor protein with MHYT domain